MTRKKITFKYAFTLAEILIVVMIIGLLASILLHNLSIDTFNDKRFKTGAVKIIQEFNVASAKIRDLEKTKCPTATFTIDVAGSEEYALTKDGTNLLTDSDDLLDLYGEYIKLDYPQKGHYNFCDVTGWSDCPDGIKGARIAGDMYVGMKVTASATSLADCPNYFRINTNVKAETEGVANPNTEVTPDNTTKKCWANLYMDINGKQGPNTLGEDVFVYGMEKGGVLY